MALARLTKVVDGSCFPTAMSPRNVMEVEPLGSPSMDGARTLLTLVEGIVVVVAEEFEAVVEALDAAEHSDPAERFVHYTTVGGKASCLWVGAVLGIVDHGDHRELAFRDGRVLHVATTYEELARQLDNRE